MRNKKEQKREEWLEEVIRLVKERDKINDRIDYLRGLSNPKTGNEALNNAVSGNIGFPYLKEVENLFREKQQLKTLEATALLKQKFSSFSIERVKVQTTITYLVKKNILVKEQERSLYSLKR